LSWDYGVTFIATFWKSLEFHLNCDDLISLSKVQMLDFSGKIRVMYLLSWMFKRSFKISFSSLCANANLWKILCMKDNLWRLLTWKSWSVYVKTSTFMLRKVCLSRLFCWKLVCCHLLVCVCVQDTVIQ